MFAWRGRIGLIQPTHRGKSFHYWYRLAPPGVEIVPTFVGFRKGERQAFEVGLSRAEEIAADLSGIGVGVLVVGGAPPFLLKGYDFELAWMRSLEERCGAPVVTALQASGLALKTLGVRRVALASYFGPELNEAMARHFAPFGVASVVVDGYRRQGADEDLYTTPLMALDEVDAEDVYRYCRSAVAPVRDRVDGLFVAGSGWDATPVTEALERDLGIPVVVSLIAQAWLAFRRLGVAEPRDGYGMLLREHAGAPV